MSDTSGSARHGAHPVTSDAVNFRDFGGLQTVTGGRVKSDRLYRSGHWPLLCATEIERLHHLDFGLIVDLRDPHEREDTPCAWPVPYTRHVLSFDVPQTGAAPHLEMLRVLGEGQEGVDRRYRAHYAGIALDPAYQRFFVSALDRLAGLDGRALIHCTAGKDRTGIFCAMVLHILGVSRDAIVEEYLRTTNTHGLDEIYEQLEKWIAKEAGADNAAEQAGWIMRAKADYLQAALEAIETRAGSIEVYLREAGFSRVNQELLQDRFVEERTNSTQPWPG